MKRNITKKVVWLLAVSLAACTGPDVRLDEAAPTDFSELRARMNITARDSQGAAAELSPTQVTAELETDCDALLLNPPVGQGSALAQCGGSFDPMTDDERPLIKACLLVDCAVEEGLCVANRLMELSQTVDSFDLGTYRVPPQPLAARAALQEQALKVARIAGVRAATALRLASIDSQSGCRASNLTQYAFKLGGPDLPTVGEDLATSLVEATQIVRESVQQTAENQASVADGEFSEQPSETRANRFALLAPVLSRGHAAELIAGPARSAPAAFALPSFAGQPRAITRSLDQAGSAALQAFRQAAAAPSAIRDDGLTLEELVIGDTTVKPDLKGSLRERLDELWGQTLPTDPDLFAEALGTTMAGFGAAREWLRQEQRTFARSQTMVMPALTLDHPNALGGALTTSFDRFAGTANPPTAPPDGYFQALAFDGMGESSDCSSTSLAGARTLSLDYAKLGATQALDFLATSSQLILGAPSSATLLPDDTRRPLAPLATGALNHRVARLEVQTTPTGAGKLRVLGIPANEVLVVEGADGLRCAVEGNVDGAGCNAADYSLGTVVSVPPPSGFGFTHCADLELPSSVIPSSSDPAHTLHVLRKKPGATSGAAGGYIQLGGTTLRASNSGTNECNVTPLAPWALDLIGSLLRPDVVEPTRAEEPCARIADHRIPLENELSEDGDQFESSWRGYLQRARASANEADRLGEILLEHGLERDRQAEGAMEELEQACGGRVDIDPFANPSGDPTAGPCTDDTDCTDEEYSCAGGTCTLDPVAATLAGAGEGPEGERLRQCLAADKLVDFVALGNQKLCVWRSMTNPNAICETDAFDLAEGESAPDCPWRQVDDDCVSPGLPAGLVVAAVNTTLDLYDGRAGGGGGLGEGGEARRAICDDLQLLRDRTALASNRDLAQARINAWPGLQPGAVRAGASEIAWEPEPYDLSTATRSGDRWIGTGVLVTGPNTGWPCAAAGDPPGELPPRCREHPNSGAFFCLPTIDCTVPEQRARFNDRLGRAVLAIRTLSAAGLEDTRFPFVDVHGDHHAKNPEGGDRHAVDVNWRSPVGFSITQRTDVTYYDGSGPDGLNRNTEGFKSSLRPQIFCDLSSLVDPMWTLFRRSQVVSSDRAVGDCRHPWLSFDFGEDLNRGEAVSYANDFWTSRAGSTDLVSRTLVGVLADVRDDLDESSLRGLVNAIPSSNYVLSNNELRDHLSKYWKIHSDYQPQRPFRNPSDGDPADNDAFISGPGLTRQAIMDGLDLYCELPLTQSGVTVSRVDCGDLTPPTVRTLADLPELRRYMSCIAGEIETRAQTTVFANVPQVVVDSVKGADGIGSFPRSGGDFGVAAARLRQGIVQFQLQDPMLASELRQLAEDIRQVELAAQASDLRDELNDLSFDSTVIGQTAACAASSTNLSFGSAVTCAAAAAQIVVAFKEKLVQRELNDVMLESTLSQFRQSFDRRLSNLEQIGANLRSAKEDIDAGLAGVDSLRRRARSSIARATFADSDGAGRHYRVNTVTRRRFNTDLVRYETARTNAMRMTYLARVALEQRLGLRLEDLDSDLSLVDAPSGWANDICQLPAMNYQSIRDSSDPTFEDDYQRAYLGDYVTKLENVVESYRLDFPFHEGHDTSVISIRDEIANIRATCDGDSRNLLFESSDLAALEDVDEGVPGWVVEGCPAVTRVDGAGIATTAVYDCVHAEALGESVDRTLDDTRSPRVWRLIYGDGTDLGMASDPSVDSFRWDADNHSSLAQYVDLEAGRRYRVSWYAAAEADPGPVPASVVHLYDDTGAEVALPHRVETSSNVPRFGRYFAFFDTFGNGSVRTYRLALEPDGTPPLLNQAVDVAGFMLEDVTDRVRGAEGMPATGGTDGGVAEMPPAGTFDPANFPPGLYWDTQRDRTMPVACEDTDGRLFRLRSWHRVCEPSCPASIASCSPDQQINRCYRQTSFTISLPAIENEQLIHSGGFARGNYNYRIDGIGLNLVGTQIQDCSDAELPSSCYGSGSIPFSITHLGPYPVRNTFGSDSYEAPLFTGNIEHGRSLAAERYLTNPLSSADRGLIEPYLRREFRGRPISGTYIVKIWEQPGMHFDRIEDVQLLLDYRYWTRLN